MKDIYLLSSFGRVSEGLQIGKRPLYYLYAFLVHPYGFFLDCFMMSKVLLNSLPPVVFLEPLFDEVRVGVRLGVYIGPCL